MDYSQHKRVTLCIKETNISSEVQHWGIIPILKAHEAMKVTLNMTSKKVCDLPTVIIDISDDVVVTLLEVHLCYLCFLSCAFVKIAPYIISILAWLNIALTLI